MEETAKVGFQVHHLKLDTPEVAGIAGLVLVMAEPRVPLDKHGVQDLTAHQVTRVLQVARVTLGMGETQAIRVAAVAHLQH
jgi:hypothetical protein